jgi:hypothetical protein
VEGGEREDRGEERGRMAGRARDVNEAERLEDKEDEEESDELKNESRGTRKENGGGRSGYLDNV